MYDQLDILYYYMIVAFSRRLTIFWQGVEEEFSDEREAGVCRAEGADSTEEDATSGGGPPLQLPAQ